MNTESGQSFPFVAPLAMILDNGCDKKDLGLLARVVFLIFADWATTND
jgi:hypothetical protein